MAKSKPSEPTSSLPTTDPTSDVAAVALDDAPGTSAPPAVSDRERIAQLEAQLATLMAERIAVPAGYRLAPAADLAGEEKVARAQAEADLGYQVRSQRECDRLFPPGRPGEKRFQCSLPDGNHHPELVVNAPDHHSARGRYFEAIGVIASETQPQIAELKG